MLEFAFQGVAPREPETVPASEENGVKCWETAEKIMLLFLFAALGVSAVHLLLRDAAIDVVPFTPEQRVQVAQAVRKTFEVSTSN